MYLIVLNDDRFLANMWRQNICVTYSWCNTHTCCGIWYCNFPWVLMTTQLFGTLTTPVSIICQNATYFLSPSVSPLSVCLSIFVSVSRLFSWPWTQCSSSSWCSSRPKLRSWLQLCSIQPASRTAPLGPASRPLQPHPLPSFLCHSPSRLPL